MNIPFRLPSNLYVGLLTHNLPGNAKRQSAVIAGWQDEEGKNMLVKTYGYARVSSREQSLARQLDALAAFGVDEVFADRASGKDFERPEYLRLMKTLKAGDVLVVKSIDRLGRDYEEIISQWRDITKVREVSMVVLDMPLLDTRLEREGITGVLISDIVLQLLSYVAQVERESIRQRQAEGIASAKARGVRFGRPAIARPHDYASIRLDYLSGRITRSEAAAHLGVSVSTLAKWLREDRIAKLVDEN